MLHRIVALLLTLVLLIPCHAPAKASGLSKPEVYAAALTELKNYLNDMGSMPLNELAAQFDSLGAYQMSMPLMYYTKVLYDVDNGEFSQVFYLLDVLKENTKFGKFLEEDGELGTLEDAVNYAHGRQCETDGDIAQAVAYYHQCM